MNLREILQGIHDRHRELTGRVVVDEAADPAHPLHSRFEWDNDVAGDSYRVLQAETMIRSVKIRYVEEPEPRSVRAFVPIRTESGSTSYEPTEQVLADPVARELLLRQMRRDFVAFRRRYEHLAEFVELLAKQDSGAA